MATLTSFFSSGSSGGGGTRSACIQDSFGTGAYEVFYTDGTFTVPSGVTDIRVKVYGAGGASGGLQGAGGGGFAMGCIGSLSGGDTFAVTVGQGGGVSWRVPDTFCCNQGTSGGNGVCTRIVNTSTTSNFGGGCVCATGGCNGYSFPELRLFNNGCCQIGHQYYCKCSCCLHVGGTGGGTCASLTKTGGAGSVVCPGCVTSTNTLCCSICVFQINAAAGGGASAGNQCGDGYAGFCYCRLWCCQRTFWRCGAIGAAGSLGSNTLVHRCDVGHCVQANVACCSFPQCVEPGFGVQPTNQIIDMTQNSTMGFAPTVACLPTCESFIGQNIHINYTAVKQQVSYDQPDQPVPGEFLHGAGGASIYNSADHGYHVSIGGGRGDGAGCCCSRIYTPERQRRMATVYATAGDGEPGGGGGSVTLQHIWNKNCSCHCCCPDQHYCVDYVVKAGDGGFGAGGGSIFLQYTHGCCTSCTDSSAQIQRGTLRAGRGGIGGGGSGGISWCAREQCNHRTGTFTYEARGGNGVIIVEY